MASSCAPSAGAQLGEDDAHRCRGTADLDRIRLDVESSGRAGTGHDLCCGQCLQQSFVVEGPDPRARAGE